MNSNMRSPEHWRFTRQVDGCFHLYIHSISNEWFLSSEPLVYFLLSSVNPDFSSLGKSPKWKNYSWSHNKQNSILQSCRLLLKVQNNPTPTTTFNFLSVSILAQVGFGISKVSLQNLPLPFSAVMAATQVSLTPLSPGVNETKSTSQHWCRDQG